MKTPYSIINEFYAVTGSVCSDHRFSVSAGLGCGTNYNKKPDKNKKKRRKAQRIARRRNRS